jgi:hypothetical protein
MTVAEKTDGGDPVVFEFSGLLEVSGSATRCNNLSLDLGVGLTNDPEDDPMLRLFVSDDLGATETQMEPQSLGRQGERRTGVSWSRLGMLRRPGRVHRWSTTEPVTVRKAKYNEPLR